MIIIAYIFWPLGIVFGVLQSKTVPEWQGGTGFTVRQLGQWLATCATCGPTWVALATLAVSTRIFVTHSRRWDQARKSAEHGGSAQSSRDASRAS